MTGEELPLQELFTRLREAGLPLGIEEYRLVLRALQSGFGIGDRNSLARLCRTVWVKSPEERQLFDYHFEQVMAQAEESLRREEEREAMRTTSESQQLTPPRWQRIPLTFRNVLLGGGLVLGTGIFWVIFISKGQQRCPTFTSPPPVERASRDEEYIHEIRTEPCKAGTPEELTVTATQKPPWLALEDNGRGRATLSGVPPSYFEYANTQVWDIDSGQPLADVSYQQGFDFIKGIPRLADTLPSQLPDFHPQFSVYGLGFSPDGQHLATTATQESHTVDLRTISGKLLKPLPLPHEEHRVSDVSFSPDGQRLVTTVSGSSTAYLWTIAGELVEPLKHQGWVNDVSFSPDGQRLVTVSGDGMAQLWDFQGDLIVDQLPTQGYPNKVEFSPQGDRFATFTRGGTIRLWDVSGNRLATFHPAGWSSEMAFSPNGQHFLTVGVNADSSSRDRIAEVWDIASGEQIATFQPPEDTIRVDFSPDGQRLAVASSTAVSLWTISGEQLTRWETQNWSRDVSFSPDGQRLATASGDTAYIWEVSGEQLAAFSHPDRIFSVSFSPDGRHLVTTSSTRNTNVVLQVRDEQGNIATQSFTIPIEIDYQPYIIGSLLVLLVLSGGYVLVRWIGESSANRHYNELSRLPPLTPEALVPESASELTRQWDDEVQVAKAVKQATRPDTEPFQHPFTQTDDYFPVTRRQMKQSWRYLRRLVREGAPTELDVEATVNQIGAQGLLLSPVMVPRRVNRSELLLLVDRDGSMVPFHALCDRLSETALQGSRLARADIYYFHNCPTRYLYSDPYHLEAEPIGDLFASLRSDAGVLICSDAGAARGGYSPERVELTAAFLDRLKQQVRYIAWINPLPRDRWRGTTAGEIARLVPMFEFDRQGLQAAIAVLRGKLAPQLV